MQGLSEKVKALIADGESERVEFKKSFGKDVIETAVAFVVHCQP